MFSVWSVVTLAVCVFGFSQLSPSGRCATLQVCPLRWPATDQLLLAVWPGTARITRRYTAIAHGGLQFLSTPHLPTKHNEELFCWMENLLFLLSGLGMYESPLFLASHEEESGGRSVPTTPLQVAAPGIWLRLSFHQLTVFMALQKKKKKKSLYLCFFLLNLLFQ